MDAVKKKWMKNMIVKVWERCRSHGSTTRGKRSSSSSSSSSGTANFDALKKSKSWHCSTTRSSSASLEEDHKGKKKSQVAPEGCFSVYVGPQKQRFVVKTEFANHPLFQMLLEDAEHEYGFSSAGPLQLPCDVDLFYKVLAEMDSGEEISTPPPLCGFAYSPLILCSPSRRQINSSLDHRGYGSYKLLTPSPMLKLNTY